MYRKCVVYVTLAGGALKFRAVNIINIDMIAVYYSIGLWYKSTNTPIILRREGQATCYYIV